MRLIQNQDHDIPLTRSENKLLSKLKFFILTIFGFLLTAASTVSAQVLGNEYGAATGLTATDPRLIAAQIIRAGLGVIGFVVLVIIIYAGYRILTSGGNETVVEEAKSTLRNAVIGLAIILTSLAITQFIIIRLNEAIVGPGTETAGANVAGFSPLSGALGGGIIADHYPARNAKDVPRNAKIIVTFKDPINPASLIKNYNDHNTPADLSDDTATKNDNGTPADPTDDYFELNIDALTVATFLSNGSLSAPLGSGDIKVYFTKDLLNYTFVPVQPMGSPTTNVDYEVHFIGGSKGIKKIDGTNGFDGVFNQGYAWTFNVSTNLDVTPPKILSQFPTANGCVDKTGGVCPPNTTVQVTFDEPMDPVTTSGKTGNFTNITVAQGSTAVPGEFVLTNGYRTVVFTPSQECGLNSCGGKVYCLPTGSTPIATVLKAASLSSTPPQAALPYPYDGVTDIAGNSLDGNGNGIANGPSVDSVSWSFSASGPLDLTPPQVLETLPAPETGNVDPNAPLTAVFSKVLDPSSLSSDTVPLQGAIAADQYAPKQSLVPWYVVHSATIYNPSGIPVEVGTTRPANNTIVTKMTLEHGLLVDDASYYPQMTEGIKDAYQNCFYPATVPNCTGNLSSPFCCNVSKCANGCMLSASTGEPICKP